MSTPEESSAPVKFQLLSDLHLQNSPQLYNYKIPQEADYLLLAGDIGSLGKSKNKNRPRDFQEQEKFRAFLGKQCDQFKHVFIIAGNHEYWHNAIPFGKDSLRSFAQDPRMNGRLTVLDQGRYDLKDEEKVLVTILGVTLWSRIRKNQSDAGMGDAGAIEHNSQAAHIARFEKEFQWLKDEVANVRKESATRRIVVMTHHAPAIRGTSRPEFDGIGHRWSAYQNDILGGEGVEGLQEGDVWVFGHTHWTTSFKQDEVQVYANQRGGDEERLGPVGIGPYDIRFTFEM